MINISCINQVGQPFFKHRIHPEYTEQRKKQLKGMFIPVARVIYNRFAAYCSYVGKYNMILNIIAMNSAINLCAPVLGHFAVESSVHLT